MLTKTLLASEIYKSCSFFCDKTSPFVIISTFETLDNFINQNKDLQISFVHFDLDIYDVTKFALKKIKPYLSKSAVILFDQIHHVQGWKNEYKALTEVLNENEYEFIAFSEDGQASILLNS